jgi:hypothetical protein
MTPDWSALAGTARIATAVRNAASERVGEARYIAEADAAQASIRDYLARYGVSLYDESSLFTLLAGIEMLSSMATSLALRRDAPKDPHMFAFNLLWSAFTSLLGFAPETVWNG